ncbi:MAG: cobalt ECF transporter T component CbiQ [Candidatus Methanoperedenaceae archaeon]|nr:cobalt ECF transporter T component CbiQ [Candidatus Methanoperedenaceae archaeon]
MIHSTIDTIAHTNRLRHIDTRLKVIFAITTLLITVASTSPIPPFLAFLTATILILFAAKIKPRTYFLLLLTPLFFGLVSLLLMSLFFGYADSPLYSFEILSHTFVVQKEGANMGLLVASRTLAGSACLFFLALTTPMTELFTGLKWLRIPEVVIELAMIIYRYIFVLLEEAERMWLASQMRGEGNFRTKVEVFSMLTSTLFLRTIHQGEKLFVAMNSRCYDGETNSLAYRENKTKISTISLFSILLFEAILAYVAILTQNTALI